MSRVTLIECCTVVAKIEKAKQSPNTQADDFRTVVNSVDMRLTYVPAGKFLMGSPPNEAGRNEDEFQHEVIDHAVVYVDGEIHTNGLENFWSLVKRGLNGTYISVEPFHLFRYLDEQSFRFNNRGHRDAPVNDADRFMMVVGGIVGKRLTFDELTGKNLVGSSEPF